MKALLFADMLGVKNRWKSQGKAGAQAAFNKLGELISNTLAVKPDVNPVRGFTEADSFAFVFDDVVAACEFGRRLFLNALFESKTDKHERIWLRGAIVPCPDAETLRSESKVDGTVTQSTYSDQLLEVIHVEKSGFKGMRIVVAKELLTPAVEKALTKKMGSKTLFPVMKLAYTPLPKSIATDYMDFLWMVSDNMQQWENANVTMSNRLRWCSPEMDEEFVHAAATQVVFNECAAIIKTLTKSP